MIIKRKIAFIIKVLLIIISIVAIFICSETSYKFTRDNNFGRPGAADYYRISFFHYYKLEIIVPINYQRSVNVKFYNILKHNRKICLDNIRSIESALEMYKIENNDNIPEKIEDIAQYFQCGLPKCPSGGEYLFKKDKDGYPIIICTVHGTQEVFYYKDIGK